MAQPRVLGQIAAGHTTVALALSPDEKRLYACNRFNNDVSVLDLVAGREIKRIAVEREPVAAAATPDGRYLLVANHLQAHQANQLHVGAAVSVIDTKSLALRKNIDLTLWRQLPERCCDFSEWPICGAVTDVRSCDRLSTTGVELGRMNGGALTVLDLEKLEVLGMVFLDQTSSGAAIPWAVGL